MQLKDLREIVAGLRARANALDRVIAELESFGRETFQPLPRDPRGRKSMNPAQRKEVSERMRKYWADRRNAK